MENIFDITAIINNYGYAGIALIVFLESGIFFALPGDSLLFTAGVLASTGVLSMGRLLPLVFFATFTGGLFGYFVGMHIERLHHFSFFRKILKKEYIEKAEHFYQKYGRLTIILSRFVPIVRTFAPIVAGIIKMNFIKFVQYTFLGSVLWSIIVTSVGYFLGTLIPWVKDYMTIFILLVVFLSILPIIFEIIKGKKV